ncbi:MAG TPA: hypothetical protein ENI27_07465 [bacterium]|nr:hypothetical protein [bacterium]
MTQYQTSELHNRNQTTGRCHPCNARYIWQKGRPKLRDAFCPVCGSKLQATTHLFTSGPTFHRDPVLQDAISKRVS